MLETWHRCEEYMNLKDMHRKRCRGVMTSFSFRVSFGNDVIRYLYLTSITIQMDCVIEMVFM
mgnify:CR=1 FL=1